VYVVLDAIKGESPRSNGSFGWGGAFGTVSWSDPKEQLAGVIMIQQPNSSASTDFVNAVMQAIIE